MKRSDWVELVAWAAAGVLVGGRLGYVLLYEPVVFWQSPWAALALWRGGMASHGGFIGVAAAVWIYLRLSRSTDSFWRVMDVVVVPVALGLALGRVGNVINNELFGTALMQGLAVAKNLLIVVVCYWYLRRSRVPGSTTALFLVMYAVLRWLIEYGRIQDYLLVWGMTRGQLYTIPVLVVGVWLWRYVRRSGYTDEDANKN